MVNSGPWKLPKELDQPFPRQTKASGGFYTALILPSYLFGIFGFMMLLAAWAGASQMGALKTRGIAVDGIITSIGADYRRKRGVFYDFEYRFTPLVMPNRREFITIPSSRPADSFPRLSEGQTVPVIYDPLNPDNAVLNFGDWVHKNPYSGVYSLLAAAFIMSVLPSGAAVIYFTSRFYREKELLKHGLAVPAEIIAESDTRSGRQQSLSMSYRFTDCYGQIVEGSRKNLPSNSSYETMTSQALLKTIRANSTVLYDPRNSSNNLLYPPVFATCVQPKP